MARATLSFSALEGARRYVKGLTPWIKATAPGKDLRGHGDHWFGLAILRKDWPNLRALATAVFHLGGHGFRVIEVGYTDTYNTTVLHVPSIRLVVAGDAVYVDMHQYFGEANTRAGTVDGLFNLDKTRQYILDFEDAVAKASNWEGIDPHAIQRGTTAAFPEGSAAS
ncbi:hypothetical protein BDW75DRAFT_233668 [Aspergillus navahoensis]